MDVQCKCMVREMELGGNGGRLGWLAGLQADSLGSRLVGFSTVTVQLVSWLVCWWDIEVAGGRMITKMLSLVCRLVDGVAGGGRMIKKILSFGSFVGWLGD